MVEILQLSPRGLSACFQYASSNDIHSHGESFVGGGLNDVNGMQKLPSNSSYFLLFSFVVEFANWFTFEVSLKLALMC